jgi:hypothetical protein
MPENDRTGPQFLDGALVPCAGLCGTTAVFSSDPRSWNVLMRWERLRYFFAIPVIPTPRREENGGQSCPQHA